MGRCVQCNAILYDTQIVVSSENDVVCSQKCKHTFNSEKDEYFNQIISEDSVMPRSSFKKSE